MFKQISLILLITFLALATYYLSTEKKNIKYMQEDLKSLQRPSEVESRLESLEENEETLSKRIKRLENRSKEHSRRMTKLAIMSQENWQRDNKGMKKILLNEDWTPTTDPTEISNPDLDTLHDPFVPQN